MFPGLEHCRRQDVFLHMTLSLSATNSLEREKSVGRGNCKMRNKSEKCSEKKHRPYQNQRPPQLKDCNPKSSGQENVNGETGHCYKWFVLWYGLGSGSPINSQFSEHLSELAPNDVHATQGRLLKKNGKMWESFPNRPPSPSLGIFFPILLFIFGRLC